MLSSFIFIHRMEDCHSVLSRAPIRLVTNPRDMIVLLIVLLLNFFHFLRLAWKDGQWRKLKPSLSNSHNALLSILCHLFYFCQPDWLLRVVDKGLGTLQHALEGVAGHAESERSYEVCVCWYTYCILIRNQHTVYNSLPLVLKNIYWIGHAACARFAQLVRSPTANQKVSSSIPGLVESWTLGALSPHRPWTGMLSRCSSLWMFYRGT